MSTTPQAIIDERLALIAAYGFKFNRSCNCAGPKTGIYKRGKMELHYSPSRDLFKFRDGGATVKRWTNAKEMVEYFKWKIGPRP